jgi:hypothetical protein
MQGHAAICGEPRTFAFEHGYDAGELIDACRWNCCAAQFVGADGETAHACTISELLRREPDQGPRITDLRPIYLSNQHATILGN